MRISRLGRHPLDDLCGTRHDLSSPVRFIDRIDEPIDRIAPQESVFLLRWSGKDALVKLGSAGKERPVCGQLGRVRGDASVAGMLRKAFSGTNR